MSKRDELADYLRNELYSIYCNNCRHEGKDEPCDWCHRKYMQWQVSDEVIEKACDIADKEEE